MCPGAHNQRLFLLTVRRLQHNPTVCLAFDTFCHQIFKIRLVRVILRLCHENNILYFDFSSIKKLCNIILCLEIDAKRKRPKKLFFFSTSFSSFFGHHPNLLAPFVIVSAQCRVHIVFLHTLADVL